MKTKQEKICELLASKGLKEVRGKTAKYRVFQRTNGEFYFVGRNGALRTGKNVSDSFSISYRVKNI